MSRDAEDMPDRRSVAMATMFYPRGGSAQVARYLSRALEQGEAGEGWDVSLVSGSLGRPGERTHAETFYTDVDAAGVDYNPAVRAYGQDRDPIAEPVPMHPSFEDQPDVPDRIFASVAPELGDHLARAWERLLSERWPEQPDVLHLHHLTPLQEGARRLHPDRPLVTHLHGTELKMIERVGELSAIASSLRMDLGMMADRAEAGTLPTPFRLGAEQRELFRQTRWQSWRHGEHWAERLRHAAELTDRFVAISPHDREGALRILGVDEDRVQQIPNGVDTERFDRRSLSSDERLVRWHRWLVEDPRGWDESGEPGSIPYTEHDLEAFVGHYGAASPVLLYVGRFLEFKRVPLLVRAYARARRRMAVRAPLVIWGGFPGELDGEHPATVAREEGVDSVFFAGWRGHDDLPEGLACADVLVAPSVNEPFGQVYLEAMSCGVPVIATRSGGPRSFVNTEGGAPNGWLVEPDDLDALADALVEAVNDESGRLERSENAYRQIRRDYGWDRLARRFIALYEDVAQTAAGRSA